MPLQTQEHPAADETLLRPLDILVVEDHDLLREELVAFLQRPRWRLRGVGDGEQMDRALRQRPADLLVIDLNLPGEDGLSLCRRLRQALPELGLVLLTARTLAHDKVLGYQSGADVYLTKPANVHELEAALLNLARRLPRQASSRGLHLDLPSLRLSDPAGAAVALTLAEARLLYELALAPQRRLDTEDLLHRLDPRQARPVHRDNLPVLISRLRSKVSAGLGRDTLIKAVRGYGYQLVEALTLSL